MFCPQCGSEKDDSADFCYKCSSPVDINKSPDSHTYLGSHVTFAEAVKLYFANILRFEGRATNSEFWWAFLFRYLVLIFLITLGFMSFLFAEDAGIAFFLLAIGYNFVDKYFLSISISIRRLHDSGKSGYHYFWKFIPFIGGIILLIMLAEKSDPDHNKYG